jgi:hypothetical protein
VNIYVMSTGGAALSLHRSLEGAQAAGEAHHRTEHQDPKATLEWRQNPIAQRDGQFLTVGRDPKHPIGSIYVYARTLEA